MTLVTVQGAMRLEQNAAASFQRVDAKFGGRLVITSPYGAHRAESDQAYLRQGYVRGLPGFNYAAPARKSNHEGQAPDWEGFAVDISNWALFPTLRAEMAAEGWVRDPVEQWHYNYRGKRTTAMTAATAGTPITADEEDDMPTVDEIAEAVGQKIFRNFWVGESDPLNKPFGEVLYELLILARATNTNANAIRATDGAEAGVIRAAVAEALANAPLTGDASVDQVATLLTTVAANVASIIGKVDATPAATVNALKNAL